MRKEVEDVIWMVGTAALQAGLALAMSVDLARAEPDDKVLHALAGIGIAYGVEEVLEANGVPERRAKRWGCAAALGAGVLKEAYDSTGRGTVDGMDVVATGVPACVLFQIRW